MIDALSTLARPRPALAVAPAQRYMILALTSFVSVLLLITVGSIVRVTGNGLGCPDWPLCYGQVVPPLQMSAWVEFSHRLLGGLTSAQLVAMGLIAHRSLRHERWLYRPAMLVLALLAVQVTLGGLHVIYELPPASGWLHTGVAMAITAVIASQVALTLPWARAAAARAGALVARDPGLPVALATTAVAAYLLILTGAYVTRSGASLACPSFPHCGAEAYAIAFPELIKVQMWHRFMAFGVALTAAATLLRLVRAARGDRTWRLFSLGLTALIAVQFGLGISNVVLRLPMWSRTLHLLVAALLWAGLVMLWVLIRQGQRPRVPRGTAPSAS